MKSLKKNSKILYRLFVFLSIVFIICPFLFTNRIHAYASEIGEKLGNDVGTVVGWATGSFKGITEGNAAGFQAGREEALSAKDTLVEIEKINEIGKLEVLVVTYSSKDVNKVGNDYAALYLLRGEAVFTVDLEQAFFESETHSLYIPKPQLNCYIDPGEIQKAAEYQKTFFSGATEDGFIEYINSLSELTNTYEESVRNDEYLQSLAQTAAITQVELLVKNIRIEDGQIQVLFSEDER